MFDAGSSHTSLFVYQWPANKENDTGVVSQALACQVEGQWTVCQQGRGWELLAAANWALSRTGLWAAVVQAGAGQQQIDLKEKGSESSRESPKRPSWSVGAGPGLRRGPSRASPRVPPVPLLRLL